jgi:hypothetical protein
MARTKDDKNLRLAGLFIIIVLGLIVISALFKFLLIVKDSRFDGSHNFIVSFIGKDREEVVSFSPQNRTLSILDIDSKYNNKDLTKTFEIPIDGTVVSQNINSDNISSPLLKGVISLGQPLKKLTILDALRLFLFCKTIPQNNVYERQLSSGLNDAQRSTVINLSLTDTSIYQENQTIQIINASNVPGLGTRLATLITNIGGNVILVSTADETLQKSQIVYYGDKTYTVKKISDYLQIPAVVSNQRGVADVIITIGKDKISSPDF